MPTPATCLLTEQVDRLSRLTVADWERLEREIADRRIRVVALDPPTSWMTAAGNGNAFTARMFEAVNGMMLDVLAAVARKDDEDRRRRQAQGQARAKAQGLYRGPGRGHGAQRRHRRDAHRRADVVSQVQAAAGCSRARIAKIAKRVAAGRRRPAAPP